MSAFWELQTDRLRLLPLPLSAIRLLMQNREVMEEQLGLAPSGVRIPASIAKEFTEVLPILRQKVELAPERYRWHSHWEIILKMENRVVGGLGIAGEADNEGKIFIGYWIDERYQRNGYMTEALAALTQWAFSYPEVLLVTASTPVGNVASQRVLVKNGFQRRGEYDGHPFFVLGRPLV